MKDIKKHNGIIGLWKFLFCLMIIIYHGRFFTKGHPLLYKGSIGVEFFFIVSGFLMARSALKKNENENISKDTFNYIWKKYKTFIPYSIIGGILCLAILNYYTNLNCYKNISSFIETFLLSMSGIKCYSINRPIWYLSSMLIGMSILYPLLKKYKEKIIYTVLPLVILFGFAYINQNKLNYRNPDTWINFTYVGNIRAIIELSLGSIVYLLYTKFKEIKFNNFGKFILTIIELIGFIAPFVTAQFVKHYKFDFIILILLSISILLAFSEQTLECKILSNKFVNYLEKLSFPLYIFNNPVRIFITKSNIFTKCSYYEKLALLLLITFIISIIIMHSIEYLKKRKILSNIYSKLIIK